MAGLAENKGKVSKYDLLLK